MKNIVKEKQKVRKLTPHDLAFGISRKVTDEEWEQLIEDTKDDTFSDAEIVLKRIDIALEKAKK
jgi:hypothetical protein